MAWLSRVVPSQVRATVLWGEGGGNMSMHTQILYYASWIHHLKPAAGKGSSMTWAAAIARMTFSRSSFSPFGPLMGLINIRNAWKCSKASIPDLMWHKRRFALEHCPKTYMTVAFRADSVHTIISNYRPAIRSTYNCCHDRRLAESSIKRYASLS